MHHTPASDGLAVTQVAKSYCISCLLSNGYRRLLIRR